jgi:hypothetical protein
MLERIQTIESELRSGHWVLPSAEGGRWWFRKSFYSSKYSQCKLQKQQGAGAHPGEPQRLCFAVSMFLIPILNQPL